MIRRLYLFDDDVARGWRPFSLTRPVGELLFGALLLRSRIERATGLAVEGYLGRPELHGFEEPGAPPVLGESPQLGATGRIILLSRYVPPLTESGGTAPSLNLPRELPPEGIQLVANGATVGWMLPASAPLMSLEALRDPASVEPAPSNSSRRLELPGSLLPDPWSLMAGNARRTSMDLELLFPGGSGPGVDPLPELDGVRRLGPHPVSAAEDVEVEPEVVLDTREGPIHLARGVRVHAFTRLRGPAFIGPDSVLLGGTLERVSCGPVSKLHGEVSDSVVNGYSNKAHHGYLGHAVLGRWVNLGAMTTNSDLKNTYGTVRVPAPSGDGEVDSGLLKAGVLLGDHVKTGIGILLNTGSVVGAGSNLFGTELPPRDVPPFSWGTGSRLTVYRRESFLTTTERVMQRRDLPLSPAMHTLLTRIWDRANEREGDT